MPVSYYLSQVDMRVLNGMHLKFDGTQVISQEEGKVCYPVLEHPNFISSLHLITGHLITDYKLIHLFNNRFESNTYDACIVFTFELKRRYSQTSTSLSCRFQSQENLQLSFSRSKASVSSLNLVLPSKETKEWKLGELKMRSRRLSFRETCVGQLRRFEPIRWLPVHHMSTNAYNPNSWFLSKSTWFRTYSLSELVSWRTLLNCALLYESVSNSPAKWRLTKISRPCSDRVLALRFL